MHGMGAPMGKAEPEVIRNLMVNYIPTTIDEVQLRQLFEPYGPVESVKIVVDRETRTSKGYGFVKYRFGFSAVQAIQYLNGYAMLNKRLKVAYANQEGAQKALENPAGSQAGAEGFGGQQQPEVDMQQLMWQQAMYMNQLAALQQMMQFQAAMPQHQHMQHQQHHQAQLGGRSGGTSPPQQQHQQQQQQHQQQQQPSPDEPKSQ